MYICSTAYDVLIHFDYCMLPSIGVNVTFQEASYSINEADESVMVCVDIEGVLARPITLMLSTISLTALDSDFTPVNQTVITAEPSTCITVPISNDSLVEEQEVFSVVMSNVNGDSAVNILQSNVTVFINDSSTVSLDFAMPSYSVLENASVSVCVQLFGTTNRTLMAILQVNNSCEFTQYLQCYASIQFKPYQ